MKEEHSHFRKMEKTLQSLSWLAVSAGNADAEVWSQAGKCSSGLYSLPSPPFPRQACSRLLQELVPLKCTLSQSKLPLSASFRCGRAAQSADWEPAAAGRAFHLLLRRRQLSGPPSQPVCSSAPARRGGGRGSPPPFTGSLEKCMCTSADFALVGMAPRGAPNVSAGSPPH